MPIADCFIIAFCAFVLGICVMGGKWGNDEN